MADLHIELPEKLIPVFEGPADVRGAYGGRGSAKTRSFATMAAVQGLRFGQAGVRGLILCGRQFMNSLADSSLEECKRAIQDNPVLTAYYEIGDTFIRSKDRRIEFVFCGLDRNIESIKSKGRILLLWVDEAEPVTEQAWSIVVPTLREEGAGWNAELWVTWNPKRKGSPVEARWRDSSDPRVKVVQLNWRDNPRFPAMLERARQRDLSERPELYDHVWEGAHATTLPGAYFAAGLVLAQQEGRIGVVPRDPLMQLRAHVDIGGTGARADAFAMWISQNVGHQVRVLDHYEAVGQTAEFHFAELRKRGYGPDVLSVYLPHDGSAQDKVHDTSYEKAFRDAGYAVTVVPNQGRGAARQRIDAVRRLMPAMWFNEATTAGGRAALGWYHEKRDEQRGIGLGPDHDWSSHSADAAGLLAITHEPPSASWGKPLAYPKMGYA